MKTLLTLFLTTASLAVFSQNVMTPELMWSLGRVSALGISKDGTSVVYQISTPSVSENKSTVKLYSVALSGGPAKEISNTSDLITDHNISPDGKYTLSTREVKVKNVFAQDFYPELDKANAQIYETLNYRHWDQWEDGKFSHLFITPSGKGESDARDLMPNEPYDCPQKPFGDEHDYVWSPDSKAVLYVSKKKYGKDYAVSTNTDIYSYDVATGATTNLSEGMMGYDTRPQFSSKGTLAWLSMKRDGFESDKNDIVVKTPTGTFNVTRPWDGTVNDYTWSTDGNSLYFTAAVDGTVQLFQATYSLTSEGEPKVKQITKGEFDINQIVGQAGNRMVVSRMDMNHPSELYTVDLSSGQMSQLTHVNDETFKKINLSKVERRFVTTTDNKKMLVWVIFPPNFDATKKYPTLLYCQGGPQSALSQFYSYRWNFQLMAASGYIVVAPNRRGMPGHGVAWNEQISKDHGGQVMQDYLSAIDDVTKESYVDKSRLGCVGPSYGGYSVFYLAGIHNKRFKTFFSHDGIFNLKSMYGTTEELFFVDWDYGGAYWDKGNAAAQKTYEKFDPSTIVDKWDTPIMIVQGGKDYRVPTGQGLEAFQAAQLRGIKSRLLYLPEENHWVLRAQNAIVWQREFFRWLKETL